MKIVWLVVFVLSLSTVVLGQVGNYRTRTSGDWNVPGTWERDADSNGSFEESPSSVAPNTASTVGTITIQNLHTVTVTASVTINETTINAGGILIVNGTRTLTVSDGTGTDLTINGTLTCNGNLTATNSSIIANSGFTIVGNLTISGGGSSFNVVGANYTIGRIVVTNPGTFLADAASNGIVTGNIEGTGTYTSQGLTTITGNINIVNGGIKTFNNLTVNGSISATSVVNVYVNGNLVNNGIINFSDGTWTFFGSGKTISGTLSQTSFFNLAINNGASVTTSIPFNAGGTLNVLGSSLPIGSLTTNEYFSVGGNITIRGSLTATSGFEALATLTVDAATGSLTSSNVFFETTGLLTVSGGALLTANAGFDAAGAVTVTGSNSIINVNAPFSVAGTLTSNTSGAFNANADGILTGNLAGSSTYTSTATTTFNGTTQLSGGGIKTFKHVVVNGNLTSSGNINLRVNGDITNNASINLTSGTLTLQGSPGLVKTASTPSVTNFFNLAVGSDAVITSSISFNAGGTLNVTSTIPVGTLTTQQPVTINGNVTVGGTLNANSSFTAASTVTVSATTGNINSSGGAFGVTGTLTVNGIANFQAGLNASGNVTVATTGSLTTGTVASNIGGILAVNGTYNATSNLTLTGTTGNNFTLGASGNFTSTATVIFNGTTTLTTSAGTNSRTFQNIQVNSSRTLTGATGTTFRVNGNITNNGGTINLTSGTLTFNASGTNLITGASPLGTTFNAVVINSAAGVVVDSDISISGNLTINGTIGVNSGFTTTFGNCVISGSSVGIKSFWHVTITTSLTPNIDVQINGNITANGNIVANATSGTVFLTGTTNITGTGSVGFRNLFITGTLQSAPGTVTIWNDLTNNGVCNLSSGTIAFNTNPTVQQNIRGNQNTTLNNLTIANVVASTGVDISNEIDAGKTLGLRGRLTFSESNVIFDSDGSTGNRTLVLLSSADEPITDGTIGPITSGSSISNGGAAPTFTPFTVQRYMSSENRIWRYIASPVVGATVATLQSAFPVSGNFTGRTPAGCAQCGGSPAYNETAASLYYYQETPIQGYIAYPTTNSTAPLLNGRGYAVFVRQDGLSGPATINFTGTHPNTATLGYISLPVNPTLNGFSLVGNPYPSAIVWDPTGPGWSGTTGVGSAVKVRDNGAGGVFRTISTGGVIAPGQSFWVETTGASPVLRINENAKTNAAAIFYRQSEPIADQVVLQMTKVSTGVTDEAFIKIQAGSSNDFDYFDATKSDNTLQVLRANGTLGSVQVFDFSSLTRDARPVSLNAMPSLECSQQIDLNISQMLVDVNGTAESSADYILNFNPSGSFSALTWTLKDNFTNTFTNLSLHPTYNFTVTSSSPNSYSPSRFSLTVSPLAINTSTPISTSPTICATSDAVIQIVNSQNGMTYGAEVNGVYYPNLAQGNGRNLSLIIDSDKLSIGANAIRIKVNSGCQEQFLTSSISINKLETYQVTSTTDASACKAGAVVLSASGAPADAVYNWYPNAYSGTVLYTGAQFTTPSISETSTYYVAALNTLGCEGDRVPVTAYISRLTTDITITSSAETVCRGETITFSANAQEPNISFKWYESLTSNTSLSSGREFTTPPLSTTKSFYVTRLNEAGCEGDRFEVVASIYNFDPVVQVISARSITCAGGTHTFTASGVPSGSTYLWFSSPRDLLPIAETEVFETEALAASRYYYVAGKNEFGCVSNRVAVEAKVDIVNASKDIRPTIETVCQGQDVLLGATGISSGGRYRWYANGNDEYPLADGLNTSWDRLSYRNAYYLSGVNANGCEGTRKPFELNVINFANAQIDSVSNGEYISNFTNGNQWFFDGKELIGANTQSINVGKAGDYSLRVLIQDKCETWASRRNEVNVVSALEQDPDLKFIIYPNPAKNSITVKYYDVFKVRPQLYDVSGRLISEIEMESSDNFEWSGKADLQWVSPGFYFVKIKCGKSVIVRKVVIE